MNVESRNTTQLTRSHTVKESHHASSNVRYRASGIFFIRWPSPGSNGLQALTNDDLAAMAQDGLDQTTIVSAIHAQNSSFDISASSLLRLKQTGVTPIVMGAMFAAVAGKQTPVEPFVAAAPVQPVASPAAPAS
jgi:hypothetical protein